MTISAKIILDSITDAGVRVTTFELRYPRLIHSELMTHRVFSRNASSSRAIPVNRLIQDVINDTAMPSRWGRNQPGMQAGEDWNRPIKINQYSDDWVWTGEDEISVDTLETVYVSPEEAWLKARDAAVKFARAFADAEYHKQCVNRLLEPFAHINVLVTATNYTNWFALRYHDDADPTIRELAGAMWKVFSESNPILLRGDNWHLPYIRHKDRIDVLNSILTEGLPLNVEVADEAMYLLIKISVARCARVSYKTHDGRETTIEEDLELYDRLLAGEPLHASPAEHQVKADYKVNVRVDNEERWQKGHLHGNLTGVIQYRKTLPGEFQATFNQS